jgi:tetratricopeptide (TPR) repeat protein
VGFSTVFYLRERSARIQSEALRREAEAARMAATRARGSAEDLISWSLNDLRNKLIPVGKLELLDDIGAAAESYYQNLPPAERNAASEIRRARVLLMRGDVLFQRNELPKAVVLYQQGIDILESLAATSPPDDDQRKWLSVLLSRMGDALRASGKPSEALAVRKRELELARALAEEAPDDPQRQHNYCISLRKFAECQRDTGQFVPARRTLRKCIALSREKAPGNLPFSLLVQADWNRAGGQYESAFKSYQEAIGCFAELFADTPDNVKELRYVANAHSRSAICLIKLGRHDEARKELAAARELRERLARIDPTNRDVQGDLGSLMVTFGMLHLAENDDQQALDAFRQALHVFGELSRGDPAFIFWYYNLEKLAQASEPLVSKPDAPAPVRVFAADLHLTIAERRATNGQKDLAATALAKAGPFLDALKQAAPADPALPELARRADALRATIGDGP